MNKNTSSIAENDHVIHHTKEKFIAEYKKDPTKVVNDLVQSISSFLSVEVEPVSYQKYRRSFELDCRKAVTGILLSQFEKESLFLIFPDIIPGFTTLTYKKNNKFFTQSNKENKKKLVGAALDLRETDTGSNGASEKPRKAMANSAGAVQSANHIFNSFFQKNSQLVLLVESEEILMLFCPVSDFDKYIKQLEVYSL